LPAGCRYSTAPLRFSSAKTGSKSGSTSAPENGGVHRHPGHAQVIQGPAQFAEGLLDLRQRQRGERAEAVRLALDQSGVLVVDEPGRPGRLLPVPEVRRLRTGRQHLQPHPGPVHQPQPGLQLGAAAGPQAPRRARVRLAQVHQQVEVVIGPVVRVYIDPHDANALPRSRG
jgi:hypothetical protein